MTTETLRECPFCGKREVYVILTSLKFERGEEQYRGKCRNCGAYGPTRGLAAKRITSFYTKEEAALSWNQRALAAHPSPVEAGPRADSVDALWCMKCGYRRGTSSGQTRSKCPHGHGTLVRARLLTLEEFAKLTNAALSAPREALREAFVAGAKWEFEVLSNPGPQSNTTREAEAERRYPRQRAPSAEKIHEAFSVGPDDMFPHKPAPEPKETT